MALVSSNAYSSPTTTFSATIQCVASIATAWPFFQRESCVHHVVRSGGDLRSRELCQSKAHPQPPNTAQYKVLFYLHAAVWTVCQCQIILHHNLGDKVGWAQGVENGTNWNVDPTFLYDFYTQVIELKNFQKLFLMLKLAVAPVALTLNLSNRK